MAYLLDLLIKNKNDIDLNIIFDEKPILNYAIEKYNEANTFRHENQMQSFKNSLLFLIKYLGINIFLSTDKME